MHKLPLILVITIITVQINAMKRAREDDHNDTSTTAKKIKTYDHHADIYIPAIPSTLLAMVQQKIFTIPSLCSTSTLLRDAAKSISALAQTNKFLNTYINDDTHTLVFIKQLSQQFNCSNIHVTRHLCTKAANQRLVLQYALCNNRLALTTVSTHELNKLKNMGLDLDFTYEQKSNVLLQAVLLPMKYCHRSNTYIHDNNLAEWLINNGASINVATISEVWWQDHTTIPPQQNVSMLALRLFHKNLIPKLLQHQAFNVNYQDSNNDTLLHCCFYGLKRHHYGSNFCQFCLIVSDRPPFMYNIVQQLLEKGADPTVINKDKKTPLDLAKELKYQPLITLLEKAVSLPNQLPNPK